MAIETYMKFAVVSILFNPVLGLPAVYFSHKSKQAIEQSSGRAARRWSDLAFGFAFVGIIASIIIIVEVYAFGMFPANAYYDREELIRKTAS